MDIYLEWYHRCRRGDLCRLQRTLACHCWDRKPVDTPIHLTSSYHETKWLHKLHTGVMTVMSGKWLPPAAGWLLRMTSPSLSWLSSLRIYWEVNILLIVYRLNYNNYGIYINNNLSMFATFQCIEHVLPLYSVRHRKNAALFPSKGYLETIW